MFRTFCLLVLLIVAGSQAFGQDTQPWRMPGTRKANPVKSVTPSSWSSPQTACALLADIPGMQTRGYKSNPSVPKEYSCSSPQKSIGNGWSLENSLAYYAVGDRNTATELRLVLRLTNMDASPVGRSVLAVASDLLTKRALGGSLPDDILKALLAGRTGDWDVREHQVALTREDWPGGYEMKFIIR
jgi:hypothetical protein